MFGYSSTENEVFVLQKDKIPDVVANRTKTTTKILPLLALSKSVRREVKELQGKATFAYLKYRYGSPNTYILLAYAEGMLAHVEWIVPASRIKSRYSFVSEDSYSIISCLTAPSYRGLGIYPAQLMIVTKSAIPSDKYWIWTTSNNTNSIKGIRKAGGIKVLEFTHKKWFWGSISRIKYLPEESYSK